MRISDWSSDVCSSDLREVRELAPKKVHDLVEILPGRRLAAHHQDVLSVGGAEQPPSAALPDANAVDGIDRSAGHRLPSPDRLDDLPLAILRAGNPELGGAHHGRTRSPEERPRVAS